MIESALEKLSGLSSAFIDASSMIVCNKAEILDALAATCTLYTIQPVMDETGYSDAPVSIQPVPAAAAAGTAATVDDLLFSAVLKAQLPLISEDRTLLVKAADHGLAYYNALMVLNLLLLRRRLTPAAYSEHARLLQRATRYSAEVQQFGQAVYRQILKQL
ncbi:MAG: hypothetical protein EA404_07865 [Spirochaetaceae bacterium]|nr:MAG: hypothetical protein EA404_07865 [Spirochaetaceae bacterium]